jgi:molybdenum cofactor cytidylyltransferase
LSTAALVLAAGGSARMAAPKQLLDWGGRPLLEHTVRAVAAWPATAVVVVLGAHAEEILDRVDFGTALVVLNPGWEQGLASSLRVGLDTLTREAHYDAAFVALGDQPQVPREVPEGLLAGAAESGRPVVVPVYRYQRGNPVLVARPLWSRLMSLEGDAGANALFRAHPAWVHEVRFDFPLPPDIDTPSDFQNLPRRP